MARRRVGNPLALAVLSCLAERPMHPYEISTTLRERGKEQSIKLNYGSLYSVVDALQRHGLIEARETGREGRRPERTVYAITPEGLAEFEGWLSELLSTPVKEYLSLEAGLALMPALAPDVVARLLGVRADRLRAQLRELDAMHDEARAKGLADLFLVESRYRQHMLAAELEFVEQMVSDLRSGVLPGVKVWARIHELRDGGVPVEEIFADPVRHLGEEGRMLLPPR
ncbi:MAG: PadR family transcriptional regulator [Micromonosporaceae bacterium]|nr:PadR family transcriptional regulator [Micromonosporaceae bacterium]